MSGNFYSAEWIFDETVHGLMKFYERATIAGAASPTTEQESSPVQNGVRMCPDRENWERIS